MTRNKRACVSHSSATSVPTKGCHVAPLANIVWKPALSVSGSFSLARRTIPVAHTTDDGRYHGIVDRFDTLARANIKNSARVVDLCLTAGINQRTLLRAFRKVRNTTPSGYMRSLRMAEVRKQLQASAGSTETIAKIAMRFGFSELGRFSVSYKALFGESPSQTRRWAPAEPMRRSRRRVAS
jgi:transcriptional regulator GlxA family with amidase domain